VITDQLAAGRASRVSRQPRSGYSPPDPPATDCLDTLFARVARRTPGAVAVREAYGHLTYAGAELRATQLASTLVRGQVQLGDPVIVHCDDLRQAMVAQLAVLKAGGVCVPVGGPARDADIATVTSISGASTVLCGRSTYHRWHHVGTRLALDDADLWRQLAVRPRDRSLPRSEPLSPAYLLIGQEAARGAVGMLTDHHAWQLALTARTRAVGPIANVVIISQPPGLPSMLSAMWWALSCGGQLAAMPRGNAGGYRVAAVGGATVLSPAEYEAVLDQLPAGLRTVVLLGGPCPPQLAERHFAVRPGTRLRAEFAPVDGALPWTAREFPARHNPRPAGDVGSPLPLVRVQVLDAEGRPVSPGDVGEVCATGMPVPFDTIPGGGPTLRLRSGLLGQWRHGALELAESSPQR
jgi:non-ribosomal peptide synthetase component F